LAKKLEGRESTSGIPRIKTYIQGLDEGMQGGIPAGSVVLISGVSGTMKSSISFNILFNEALKGNNGLYLTLEQSSESFMMHLRSLGFDLNKVNIVTVSNPVEFDSKIKELKSGKSSIVLADMSLLRKGAVKGAEIGSSTLTAMIKTFVNRLKEANCSLFVLDSMSAFYIISSFEKPRQDLFNFFAFLRDSGITSLLISEMPLKRDRYGDYEIEEFLADGVIKLDLVERQRKVTREISVVKMRATNCINDVFSLEFNKGKFSALYGGQPPLL
jgi:circadian clock protein KaiC